MIRLVVNILELVHFGNILDNTEEKCAHREASLVIKVFFISFISSNKLICNCVLVSDSILRSTSGNSFITLRCN